MGVMNQIQEQQPVLVQDNSMHKAKRKDGGTGAGGQSEDEEECIATFSSDEDNDNDPSKRYGQLPLSQKITKAQPQKARPSAILASRQSWSARSC